MGLENIDMSRICIRCKFWQIEPGALDKTESDTASSLPEQLDLNIAEAAKPLLKSYGKCKATYTRSLIVLGGPSKTTRYGTLYNRGTNALFLCESKDNKGNTLFDEIEIG